MKSISLFLSILLFFALSGCGKKSETEEKAVSPETIAKESNQSSISFILKDIDERELNVTIDGEDMIFQDIDQPMVLINFFATWCPPCKGELPDLSQLQRKHAKDLFVIGILVNDEQSSTQLRSFMKKYGANFFISYTKSNDDLAERIMQKIEISDNFPIPLSVLYKNGKVFRYYEGAMPIEMMENELDQALKEPEKE